MSAARTVPELLRERAASAPQRVALMTDGGDALSFADWEARSNAVAAALARRSIGRGQRVGLLFGATQWTGYAVAYCGVQKAGAVPALVPGLLAPGEIPRLLERHAISEVIDGEKLAALEPEGDPRPVSVALEPADLAQILFTSGTTGTPKAVAASHANLAGDVATGGGPGSLSHSDHLLHAFPLGTQAGQLAMLGALTTRPTVIAMSAFDAARCCALIACHRVGSLLLAPTMAVALLRNDRLASFDLSSVALVSSTGAPLPPSVASRLGEVFPNAVVLNVYGTTESGPATTRMRCDQRRPGSVGRPVDLAEVRVTGPGGEHLGAGEPGDVWLRAAGIAPRGYLDDPVASARTFQAGWTRTGDIGYLDEEGFLYLVDRVGDVVNTGGLKVSTVEVEAAIHRHPRVAEAAVVGLPHPTLGELVAAAVVPRGELDPAELRAFLRGTLREHQVPAVVLVLDALPRVPTGKVRKGELRETLLARAAAPVPVAPQSETERLVARLWSQVLGLDAVGRDEGFIQLGGDSLSAGQVVAALADTVGVEVPSTLPFTVPTVRAQAAWLDESLAERGRSAAPPGARATAGARRVGPMLEYYWDWMHRVTPRRSVPNAAVTLRLGGELDVPALRSAINEIVRRHDALRSSFVAGPDGRPALAVRPFSALPVSVEDVPEDEARQIVEEQLAAPFDPAAAVQLRACVLRIGARDHVLAVTASHLASDGWSTGVLMRELRVLYDAFHAGEPSPLPELAAQYTDVVEWERPRYESGRRYWQRRLAQPPPLPRLPGVRPATHFSPGTLRFEVPPRVVDGLRDLGRRRDATPFMVFAALWAGALGAWSGEPEVVVSTTLAGRTRAEAEALIACLFRSVPLRVAVPPASTLAELVAAVRAAMLEAYEHQAYPVAEFVSMVEQPAALRYENWRAGPGLPGLETRPFAADALAIQELDPQDGVAGPPELLVEDSAAGCRCTLIYNAEAVDVGLAEAMSAGLLAAAARAAQAHATTARLADVFSPLIPGGDGAARAAEEQLAQFPGIADSVVLREPDGRLVAHIRGRAGHEPDPDQLRNFLLQRLPAPSIPAAFVVGDAPAGPVPAPAPVPVTPDEPRTELESFLCKIFQDLLRTGSVGVHADLFDLGAHSLVMMQAAARLADWSGHEVPRRWFYEEPTIADLAARIDAVADRP